MAAYVSQYSGDLPTWRLAHLIDDLDFTAHSACRVRPHLLFMRMREADLTALRLLFHGFGMASC